MCSDHRKGWDYCALNWSSDNCSIMFSFDTDIDKSDTSIVGDTDHREDQNSCHLTRSWGNVDIFQRRKTQRLTYPYLWRSWVQQLQVWTLVSDGLGSIFDGFSRDGHQTLTFSGKSPAKPLKWKDCAMSYSFCMYTRPATSSVFNKCFLSPPYRRHTQRTKVSEANYKGGTEAHWLSTW